MAQNPPLILTLQLDEASFAFFNSLRRQHFPAEINYLDAHLTLFHHLPNNPAVADLLRTVSTDQKAFPLRVSAIIKLGRGVAYKIESEVLMGLQHYLKQQWQPWLTPQDWQGFRPHITVQNKVEVAKAKALAEVLAGNFRPFEAQAVGFSLWEYREGPWQKVQDFNFGLLAQ